MAVGTAGFTAMLAVMALGDHGLKPGNGPVLVTGAAGGVGSVCRWRSCLALGHEVAAVTGRPENPPKAYLRDLGATRIVAPRRILERNRQTPRWKSETLGGVGVDAVGGAMLARVLGQMKYGASVSAVGLAGGAGLPATVVPFPVARREFARHRFGSATLMKTVCARGSGFRKTCRWIS